MVAAAESWPGFWCLQGLFNGGRVLRELDLSEVWADLSILQECSCAFPGVEEDVWV